MEQTSQTVTDSLSEALRDGTASEKRLNDLVDRVLALQTEIARAVAGQIRLELTPEDELRLGTDPPVDPRAHEEYLRGRVWYWKGTHGDMLRAIEHFEEAVRIDPEYALGYAGLADAYS